MGPAVVELERRIDAATDTHGRELSSSPSPGPDRPKIGRTGSANRPGLIPGSPQSPRIDRGPPANALGHLESARDVGAGIAPDELADHATTTLELGPAATLPAPALEAWLVDGELARVDGGLLVPTALAVELGGQLTGST